MTTSLPKNFTGLHQIRGVHALSWVNDNLMGIGAVASACSGEGPRPQNRQVGRSELGQWSSSGTSVHTVPRDTRCDRLLTPGELFDRSK